MHNWYFHFRVQVANDSGSYSSGGGCFVVSSTFIEAYDAARNEVYKDHRDRYNTKDVILTLSLAELKASPMIVLK